MSECANCHVSVYVPDGYEFEEGDLCMSCTKQELDSSWKLVDRLGKLLHDTANVLHGGPKENGLWSYHNVPELAEELTAKADRLQTLVSSADDRDGCMMWTSDHDKILARFKTENDKLRALLAQGKGDCVYCGLPAADIAKCPHGFPGCARMDDIVAAPETKLEVENAALFIELAALRWKLITPDNMPKIGDEVLGSQAGPHDVQAVTGYGLHYLRDHERTAKEWWDSGATHLRPINPPKEANDGRKPEPTL